MGVSGLGRGKDEQSGNVNLVMFSYSAKRRRSRAGTFDEVWMGVVAFEAVPDEYAAMLLLSRSLI